MNVTSSSLSFLLTMLLLTIPSLSTAAPLPAPTVTAVSTTPAQSYTYLSADRLAQLEQMAMGVTEAREAVGQVTQQRDAAEQKAARMAEANEQLLAQLDAARAELAEARREVAQSRRAHEEELQQVHDGAAEARRELDEVRQVLAQTQQQRDAQRRESERLKSRLDAGSEAFDLLASLRNQLEATATEVRGLKSDVADVRGVLQAPAERRALKTRVRTLEQERQRLTEQLAFEQQSMAAAVQQREALEQSVAARDLHKRELLKAMLELEGRLDTAEARLGQELDQRQAASAGAANTSAEAANTSAGAARSRADAKLRPEVPRPASGPAEEQVARRDHFTVTIPAP